MRFPAYRRRVWIGTVVFTAVFLVSWWFASQRPIRERTAGSSPSVNEATEASSTSGRTPAIGKVGEAAPAAAGQQALWAFNGPTTGVPLDPTSLATKVALIQRRQPPGRSASFSLNRDNWVTLARGDRIALVLPENETDEGVITTILPEGATTRIGGFLSRGGRFSLAQNGNEVGGMILKPALELAYTVATAADGAVRIQERWLAEVMCFNLPGAPGEPLALPALSIPVAAPPLLSSRPSAIAVLYLDFDGETVTSPEWVVLNEGNSIAAAPSSLSNAQINEVWERVSEDFRPFNVDVTTDWSRYQNAPVGQRMRVIVTPTKAWYEDHLRRENKYGGPVGGVAYLDSFALAGTTTFSSEVPAWVFNSSVVGVAEAVAHELGHTFGLRHDGRSSPTEEYFTGHGSGSTGWAPIMGSSYSRTVTQWSKGEYASANNQEDDVAIIAGNLPTSQYGVVNNVGYVADEAGNDRGSSGPIGMNGGAISQSGVIASEHDVDYYAFSTSAATLTINANPTAYSANLDLHLELQDAAGNVLATANSDQALNASLVQFVPAGSYHLVVRGSGRGNPAVDGYSRYGSLGRYNLNGWFESATPTITSSDRASVGVGHFFSYVLQATNSPTTIAAAGLPAGLSFDSGTGVISGRVNVTGVFEVGLSASNSHGTANALLTITVNDAPPAILGQTSGRRVLEPGGAVTLEVSTFSFNGSVAYQWMHNGKVIPSATSMTFALTSATVRQSGAYWVTATNAAGTTRSAPLFVSVTPAVTQLLMWGSYYGGGQLVIPADLGRVLAIAAGGSHSLALKSDGTVAAWGGGTQLSYGQVNVPTGLTDVVAIAAGGSHSLALRSDGTVVAWGGNFSGQTNVPTGLSNVVAIAASAAHSLAVKTDGTVVGWGYNGDNVSTPPAGLNSVVAVSGDGHFSLALKADGTVAAWGSPDNNQLFVPSDLNTAVAVDAGTNHSLALKASGDVVAWGSNINGALNIPAGLGTVLAVSAGPYYSAAIKADGRVAAWGLSFYGQTDVPAGLDDVFALSAGGRHLVAMRDASSDLPPSVTVQPVSQTRVEAETVTFTVSATGSGSLTYQWRKNATPIQGATSSSFTIDNLALADAGDYNVVVSNHVASTPSSTATLAVKPAPVVTRLSPERQVLSPGENLNLAVSATGTGSLTYQWTRNGAPISGAISDTYSLPAATLEHSGYYVALVTDSFGTRYSAPMFVIVAPARTQIRGWGLDSTAFTTIPARLYDAVAISAGGSPLAIKRNGTILELGGPHAPFSNTPNELTDVVAVSSGGGFRLALKSDGTVVAWGYNNSGVTQVPADLTNVVAIAASKDGGGPFALALKHNGMVVGWGNNSSGQINIPPGLANVRALAAGHSHALALKADGTVVQWGQIHHVATPAPADLTGVIAIAAGAYHSLALRSDGTVVAWGQGTQGQTAVPAGLTGVVAIAAGHYHSFALKNDGTIVAWGRNDSGQATPLSGLPNVFAISGGTAHSLAIRDATVDPLPTIDLNPVSQTVAAGSSVVLTGAASAVGQLNYQWQRDGVNLVNGTGISGATGTTLTISNVQTDSSGSYTLMASSAAGTTTSSAAVLLVHTPPSITSRPLSRTATVGQAVSFTVSATDPAGPTYPTYQWKRNGVIISEETGPTLDISSIALTDKGWYEVVVSNATVSVSSFFRLNVALPHATLVAWGLNSDGQLDAPAVLGNVASVTGGLNHGVAALVDGSVVAWGSDFAGGGVNTVPAGLSNVVALSTHHRHILALKADGTVAAWGANDSGSTNVPAGLTNVIAVANGSAHSVALKTDGTVVVWGSDNFAQKSVPAGLTDVVDIACGRLHTLALRKDGTVVAWGNNGFATVPAGLSGVIALSSYWSTNLALKADGTVVEWDVNSTTPNALPAGLINVTAIASGTNHRLALKTNGTVQAWGNGSSGETTVPAGLADVARIGAGSAQSFALVPQVAPVVTVPPQGKIVDAGSLVTLTVTATGRPLRYQWRRNNVELLDGGNISGANTATLLISGAQPADGGDYTVRVFNDVGSVVSAAAAITINGPAINSRPQSRLATEGESVSFTISATGTGALSYQWKHNGVVIPGATTATLELADVIAIDRGRYEGIVTDATGTNRTVFYLNVAVKNAALVAWGRNDGGQTNVPSNPGALASVRADRNYGLAVKADGTVLKWGNHAPALPSELTNVVDVSFGGGAAFALKADGTVVSWGEGGSPLNVPAGLNNVVAIATKAGHSIALKSDGTVATWGFSHGPAPVPADLANVVAVAAASDYYMALKSDGTVVEWGLSQFGGKAKPANLNDVVAIAAGDTYSMALRATGEVVLWRNTNGFVPLNLSNVTAIATGPGHMMALKGDGTVTAWGSNGFGETNVPSNLANAVMITCGLNFSVALVPGTAGLPVITTHPQSHTVSVGQNAVFTVAGTGSGLSYQWRKNGAALVDGGSISGATTPSLGVSNAQLSDAGSYSVVVRNTVGAVVSSATLGISSAPVITMRPLSRSALVGESVTFAATVSGSGLTYQWKRNGQVLAGATGPSLNIPSVTLADRGRYEMSVTNSLGLSARTVFMFHPTSLNSWVMGWGHNGYGQSTVPTGLGPVIGIAASGHSLAIRTDGTVVGWGPNSAGQANIPAGLNKVVSVKAGGQHSVALKSDGTVAAWGNNDYGQTNVPVGLDNVVAIDANLNGHNMALRADGTVVGWGRNGSTEIIVPAGLTDVVAISTSGSRCLAVKADGTVVVWGDSQYGPPAGMNGVVDAIWGPSRGLAIKEEGTVQGWSFASTYDQSGIPAGLNQVRALSSKWDHTLALKSDGTVVAWGNNSRGQTNVPVGLSGVFDIAAGSEYNLVLVSNNLPPLIEVHPQRLSVVSGAVASFTVQASGGTPLVYQWQRLSAASSSWTNVADGGIFSGATASELVLTVASSAMSGDQFRCIISNSGGSSTTNAAVLTANGTAAFTSASAGFSHSLFVRADGTLWGMGSNSSGQLGISTLLGNTRGPTSPVFITTHVARVAATKGYHSLFIKTDGTLWAMGANSSGQLGDGSQSARSIPVQIATGVLMAEGGSSHTLFLKTDGTLWAMGGNGSGELGDGTQIQRTSPVQIATGVARISAGSSHSMFVKTDGTLWVVGANGEGQLGTGDQINRLTPVQVAMGVARIAAGGFHSFFIKTDGTLWGMGANSSGQLGDGTLARRTSPVQIATGIVDVWAGGSHSFFLKPNGALWGMGYNFHGALGNGFGSIWSSPVQVVTGALSASGGGDHSLFIGTDGALRAMGYGSYGALGNGTTNGSSTPVAVTNLPPVITLQPVLQTVAFSETAIFTVRASPDTSALGPLSYQWYHNGTPLTDRDRILGVDESTLKISGALPVHSGSYKVIVTNPWGTVASAEVMLTVEPSVSRNSDLSGDGHADILWQNRTTGQVYLWLMEGVERVDGVDFGYHDAAWQVAGVGDINGDGHADILWQNDWTGQVYLWLMEGVARAGGVDYGVHPTDWKVAGVGDVNGDGHTDILWQNQTTGQVYLWLMEGTARVDGVDYGYHPISWKVAGVGDLNGDGHADILWQNAITGHVYLWLLERGVRVSGVDYGFHSIDWKVAGVSDLSGEGYTDILWQNVTTGQVYLWLMHGVERAGGVNLGIHHLDWNVVN